MRNFVRTAALAAVAALGTLSALPNTATADTLYFGVGDDGPRFGIVTAQDDWRHRRDWRERRDWHERREHRREARDYGRNRCSPGRALEKAERLGLSRVRLRDVDRDTIRVSGRRHGDRITVTFARAPSCPVVGF